MPRSVTMFAAQQNRETLGSGIRHESGLVHPHTTTSATTPDELPESNSPAPMNDTDSFAASSDSSAPLDRRQFVATSAILMSLGVTSSPTSGLDSETMYGLISKIDVVAGKRDALAAILLNGVAGMPGCRSYVVAKDLENPDALWVTEVWDSEEAHAESLSLPSVQAAIREGRPMIAGFSERSETEPIGGHGLA